MKPSPRQLAVLRAIDAYRSVKGYAPSIRELGNVLDISSTNGVNDHLKALERKGLVERDYVVARSLRITEQGRAELARAVAP